MRCWIPELEQLSLKYNRPGVRVLDVGVAGDVVPGGHYPFFDQADYHTLDISDKLFAEYVMDIRHTTFKPKEWDVVLVICVLEHIEDYWLAIREALRIGKVVVLAFPLVLDGNEKEEQSYQIELPKVLAECQDYKLRVYGNRIAYLEVYET